MYESDRVVGHVIFEDMADVDFKSSDNWDGIARQETSENLCSLLIDLWTVLLIWVLNLSSRSTVTSRFVIESNVEIGMHGTGDVLGLIVSLTYNQILHLVWAIFICQVCDH